MREDDKFKRCFQSFDEDGCGTISKDELYKKSNWDTDGKEVKVKFIENKDSPFDAYTPNEMKDYGKEKIKEWDTFWRPIF